MESREVSGMQAISYRNYRRARDRALVRLSHLYADEYRRLLVEEREADELEGKKWIDIGDSATDRTGGALQGGSRPTTTNQEGSSEQGNVGGEA